MVTFGIHPFVWTDAWSYESVHLIERAKALGFDVLDIPVRTLDDRDVQATRAELEALGMRAVAVAGVADPHNLTSNDELVYGPGRGLLWPDQQACWAGADRERTGAQRRWSERTRALRSGLWRKPCAGAGQPLRDLSAQYDSTGPRHAGAGGRMECGAVVGYLSYEHRGKGLLRLTGQRR